MTPTLFAIFGAAIVTTAIYLFLVWRLIARWNASHLGGTLTFTDTPAVLRAIWGSRPGKQDEMFLRLRAAVRVAFVLSGVGILLWFAAVFRLASHAH